ncbi:MAG: hypothetical protein E7668_04635 [Ruminococcaceae bacterium]|nr:hypothetical protein [Oscillospiraceae bacterium]
MSAVFQREWKALCRSLVGYVGLAVFVLLSGIFTTVYNFHFGFSEVEYSLYYLGMALALVIPLVAVKLFSADRKESGDGLLRMLPLSGRDIFWGKYWVGVSAIGAVTLILALLPIVFGFFADVNYVSAYVGLLIFFLLGNAIFAVCTFLTLVIRPRVAVFCLCYGGIGLLIALCCIAQLLPLPWKNIVAAISLFGAYLPTVLAVLEWKTAVLYGTVILVFGYLSAIAFMRRLAQTRGEKKPRKIAVVAVAVVLAVLVNTGMMLLPGAWTRTDLTKEKIFTLSEDSKTFLKDLDTEVTLYLIEGTGGDTRFEYFLEELCGHSSKLTLTRMKAEDSGELLAESGLTVQTVTGSGLPYCMVIRSDARTEVIDYYSLFYYYNTNSTLLHFLQTYFSASAQAKMSYYEYNQYLYYLELYSQQNSQFQQYWYYLVHDTSRYFQGEAILTSIIEYVSADLIPVTYRLVGNGENDLSGTLMSSLLSTYNVEYKALDLKDVEAIPDDAAAVLAAAPTADYSSEDVAKLEAYLARGGVMSVLTEESHLDMPNLMGLMQRYGLSAQKGTVGEEVEVIVEEESESDTDTESEADGNTEEGDGSEQEQTKKEPVYTVDVLLNTEHPSMANAAGQSSLAPAITNGNHLILDPASDKTLTALLTTSEKAFLGEAYEEQAVRTVAAVSEDEKTGARLFWFTGAGSYLAAITSYKDTQLYNDFCLYLAMGWTDLTYRSALTAPEATVYEVSYMTVSEKAITVYGVAAIGLIPLAILAVGTIVWYKRKKA